MTWYLQKSEGDIFGPVNISVLKKWATTGRVAPDDQISEDQANWIYAANLDDLQMDWVVHYPDGSEYGPLHVMAIKQMVEDGDLSPRLSVTHKERGDKRRVWEIALVVLFKTTRHLKESSDLLADRLSHAEAALSEKESAPADAGQAMREWKEAREEAGKFQKEAARWQSRYEDLRTQMEKEIEELRVKLSALKNENVHLNAEKEQLDIRLAQSTKRIEALQGAEGSPSGEMDAVMSSYNELSNNYEVMMRQLAGKNDEIQRLTESRSEAEQHAEQAVQDMSHRLHREQEEADAARKNFRELEDTHLQLVKAYREMNDRYIQLKQQQGVVAEPAISRPAASGSADASGSAKKEKSGSAWKPKVRLNR